MTDEDVVEAIAKAYKSAMREENYFIEDGIREALKADPLRQRLGHEAVETILHCEVESIRFKSIHRG